MDGDSILSETATETEKRLKENYIPIFGYAVYKGEDAREDSDFELCDEERDIGHVYAYKECFWVSCCDFLSSINEC
jgi:hypothetical protein